jgi:hypothetical protein
VQGEWNLRFLHGHGVLVAKKEAENMSKLVALLLLLLLMLPLAGCGSSKPDPRDRPDFVDTSDPSSIGGMAPRDTGGPGRAAPTGSAAKQ